MHIIDTVQDQRPTHQAPLFIENMLRYVTLIRGLVLWRTILSSFESVISLICVSTGGKCFKRNCLLTSKSLRRRILTVLQANSECWLIPPWPVNLSQKAESAKHPQYNHNVWLGCFELFRKWIQRFFKRIFFINIDYSFSMFILLKRTTCSELAVESFFPQSYGNESKAISLKQFTFSILLVEREMFIFDHIFDIRDEPARPSPDALWLIISQLVQKIGIQNSDTNWLSVLKISSEILNQKHSSVFKL